jgi:hypothetical protein
VRDLEVLVEGNVEHAPFVRGARTFENLDERRVGLFGRRPRPGPTLAPTSTTSRA